MSDLVLNPEDAVFQATHPLFHAGDQTAAMAITVHRVGVQTACNTWICSNGRWERAQPERVLSDEPNAMMLFGECNRLVSDPQRQAIIKGDIHLELAVRGLIEETKLLTSPDRRSERSQ